MASGPPVSPPVRPPVGAPPTQAAHGATLPRWPFIVPVAAVLVAAVAGGLLRAGIAWPGSPAAPAWLGQAAVFHAALMVCGFLGTVIGIERAVALRWWPAFAAPAASAGAAACLLGGAAGPARALLVLAAVVFVGVNALLVRRQPAAHTWLLLTSAVAWLLGNLAFGVGYGGPATLAWWFTFLVLTIAAERLEMTRLMRRRAGAGASFVAIVAVLLGGATWSCPSPALGGVFFGAALVALAAWLLLFDIARRTVHAEGLTRYMAVCLLGGYLWLAVAGAAWVAMSLGQPTHDLALHALGLGFVISMVMGHAPVILPAVARIKVAFGRGFYVPLALLHGSLLWRFGGDALGAGARASGSALNALALALFALTMLGAGLAWRRRHTRPRGPGGASLENA